MARFQATAEERDLVRRMRAGDESAFEQFADHYIPAVHRFAASRLRGERELTREVVQSTVCKVIERLDSYRGEAPLFSWLCACCRNEIANHYRRQQSQPVLVGVEDLTLASLWATPQEELLEMEADELVHQALDQLPPRYASALEWKYLEGESVEEIAHRLSLTSKAAESLLTRARKAFRDVYDQIAEEVHS